MRCANCYYACINGIRGGGVNPGLLGTSGKVSEDVVRFAMILLDEAAGLDEISSQTPCRISPFFACHGFLIPMSW